MSRTIHGVRRTATATPSDAMEQVSRPRIWTKICGITRPQDATAAARLGVDALGLILFAGSPRAVAVTRCRTVLADVPAGIERVAVLVDPDASLVNAALNSGVIDVLQFHGEESPAFCQQFGVPYIKAIRVQHYRQALATIANYPSAGRILLDSYQHNLPGGTGKTFDWAMAARLVRATSQPVVLAGGLDQANIKAAIGQVNPFGVDVVSGVESAPGIKSLPALQNFVEAIAGIE